MKHYLLYFILGLLVTGNLQSQTLKGYIYDTQTNEPLVGATVFYIDRGETKETTSDVDGAYELILPVGGLNLVVSYIGYEDVKLPIVMTREGLTRDVYMKPSINLLEDVVISAGRFEQKLSEITVSMDVLSSADIRRQSPSDLTGALNTIPGVDVNDKQPSIRGGSGWTYGVGSRSLILVDGMSVLSPNGGEINWNTIPMENINQVEVIKGASSVLYGSSALNGLINIRTERPGLVPKTTARFYAGVYGNPTDENYQWWDKSFWQEGKYPVTPLLRNSLFSGVRNPMYEGFDLSHSRRIGDFDVSGGTSLLTDEGYRQMGFNKRFNINGNVTYHQPGKNVVNYGTNFNFLSNMYGDFFIWRSPTEPYRPSAFTDMGREGNSFSLDPFFNFTNPEKDVSHRLKGRFYYAGDNINNPGGNQDIMQLLSRMGTDATVIQDLVNGDYSSLLPIIPPLLEGDLNGVVDGAFNFLGDLFPNATTADYSDLIAWFMKAGLPGDLLSSLSTGQLPSDLVPWLAEVISPTEDKTYVDKYYTYYLDYQYNKRFDTGQITVGATYEHNQAKSVVTGTHDTDNIAVFFQYDQRFFDRLSVSAGVRGEYYRVDSYYREAETKIFGLKAPFKPVFRGGLNYQLAEYSFLRASFGQGYRYPSLVENMCVKMWVG